MEAAREEVLLELKVGSNERDKEMCNEYFQGLDEVLEIFKGEIGIFDFLKYNLLIHTYQTIRIDPNVHLVSTRSYIHIGTP